MNLIDVTALGRGDYAAALPRGEFDVAAATGVVQPVCEAVRREGLPALARYSAQFDHVVPASFRVPGEALEAAYAGLEPGLVEAFRAAIERRRVVCTAELLPPETAVHLAPGATVTIRSTPVARVGLYVPGGLAPLASTVIMNVVPAQVAGVASLAVASPPEPSTGLPHPAILGLCHLLGVTEVYAVGGAQAIAMLAYGVPGLCAPADLITGPGNVYVVAAKRLVKGVVGIDAEAGPTEIMVIADETADPVLVAADLMSQAEHDPQAAAVLVTPHAPLIDAVEAELTGMVAATRHAERVREALAGRQSAAVLVRDLDQAVDVANAYAAEHLEIMTTDARALGQRITSAGAIFLGPSSPVSLGDYSAGSTHVLPTAGTAGHASGLTVRSFLKTQHVIEYDAAALAGLASGIETFALAEDLPAHANAIAVRGTR